MFQIILSLFILISTIIFMQMIHPLAMGFMLLIQTLLISLISGFMSSTFWFSYILFLVFLGGMLILFIYVTSLASNEMFSFSNKILMLTVLSMSLIFFMLFIDKFSLIPFFNNENSQNFLINIHMDTLNYKLIKLYNYPTNLITILLMNYLLLTLIAVVKITNMFFGPLRPMN